MKTLKQAEIDLDNFMASLPPKRRATMEQEQWRLNARLRQYKDPIARMNAMVVIFWEGVAEFNRSLHRL